MPSSAPINPLPPGGVALDGAFFDRDAREVACDLLGKVLCHRVEGHWLCAMVIEAEAYFLWDRASHASLGYTPKRAALFSAPGTIYMYYARGGDSFNISCRGEGNAVLFKAAVPWGVDARGEALPNNAMLAEMGRRNPLPGGRARPLGRLCAGQTLLCRALGLRVPAHDGAQIGGNLLLWDVGAPPSTIVRTTRLGIPDGRDGHLPLRFVLAAHAAHATQNPLRRNARAGRDYTLLQPPASGRWVDMLEDVGE